MTYSATALIAAAVVWTAASLSLSCSLLYASSSTDDIHDNALSSLRGGAEAQIINHQIQHLSKDPKNDMPRSHEPLVVYKKSDRSLSCSLLYASSSTDDVHDNALSSLRGGAEARIINHRQFPYIPFFSQNQHPSKDPKNAMPRSHEPLVVYKKSDRIHDQTVYLMPGESVGDRAPKFTNEMGELKKPPTGKELPAKLDSGPCKPAKAWHSFNPLNCNTFHEIDPGMHVAAEDDGNYIKFLGMAPINPLNCNTFHEIDPGMHVTAEDDGNYIKFLGNGAQRDAWVYKRNLEGLQLSAKQDRLVLKTLRWKKPYSEKVFELQRIDALASERLAGSPHVINTYGLCGMSTFNDFAGGGNFETYMKENDFTPEELLAFARNISVGVADVHEINVGVIDPDDPPGVPKNIGTIVHHDLRHHNLLLTDDHRVMISDFNTAQLLKWNFNKGKSCNFLWWTKQCGLSVLGSDRSPEKCAGDQRNTVTQKAEVYHLGAILHFLLSNRTFPYVKKFASNEGVRAFKLEGDSKTYSEKELAVKVRQKILDGEVPYLPDKVLKSEDPAIKAILRAKLDAMTYDAKDRPTARDVANYLVKVTSELGIIDGQPKRSIF
eukprot:CAMPEP_0183742812 /NCGR_PEP_ID=MMETSP0737-20130205/64891_1 /TAXON_ID=385413 /ORGANISM="Thalassiosira miniscula, Strain CCMP1093" /LENGTH=604 /DNA_ID=CAMNT_0025978405 /DNA_START=159 /DNA_END=1974 /DNA_ORIENTATION=-